MRGSFAACSLAGLFFLALLTVYSALFAVYQTDQALVVRLGQPIRTITQAGLNLKIPLIDSVIYIDNRIINVDNQAQEIIASDQTRLVVDAFARYRINNALRFYRTIGTVEGKDSRLSILLNSALRRVLGAATATDIVRDKRGQLMELVRGQLENEAKFFGIAVVDVRIKRANLPAQNSEAVYQRMQTERHRQAAGFRAEGSQRSLEIRAKADREVTVLIAQATAASEQLRGDGDAARNRIYAAAYERDPEFFAFYRTMQAYENALPDSNTRMLLTTDSDFFRYFGEPMGKFRRSKETK
jgi:membrane protease subunit HflC